MNNPTEMTNVLYIYGYGSSPESRTCLALKELLYDANVISVSYDQTDPELGLEQLLQEARNVDLVIGSSLGGWYAMHVCARLDKPCILINPLSDSTLIPTLKHVSEGTAFYGLSIDNYKEFKLNHPLFLQTMIGDRWQLECWDSIENGYIAWILWSDEDEVIKGQEKEKSVPSFFKENISNKTVIKHGKHRLTNDELRQYLIPAYEKLMTEIVTRYDNFYSKTYINP